MSHRMTRTEYLKSARLLFSPRFLDTSQLLTKARRMVSKAPKAKKQWYFEEREILRPGRATGGLVEAHTRSEALAKVKKVLGIKKGRLPIGVELTLR